MEEKVDESISFASSLKPKIKAFEGCRHLDILQDVNNKNILFSYSLWDTEEHLNLYRNSDFFKASWPKIKEWFSEKPEAWSTEVL